MTTLDGYSRTLVTAGESGARVYRCTRPGRPTLYLKRGSGRHAGHILDEVARLAWLNPLLPSPRLLHYGGDTRSAWMCTTALAGESAYQSLTRHPARAAATIRSIAAFLLRLHALPASACPFRAHHTLRLLEASHNIDAGLVDPDDFDSARHGLTVEQVWSHLNAIVPTRLGTVVTHGDFTLDNIFIHRGEVSGVIDTGRLGLADPYQDLALLWRHLEEFHPDLRLQLLRAYGLRRPDQRRLAFHLCLDEFF